MVVYYLVCLIIGLAAGVFIGAKYGQAEREFLSSELGKMRAAALRWDHMAQQKAQEDARAAEQKAVGINGDVQQGVAGFAKKL